MSLRQTPPKPQNRMPLAEAIMEREGGRQRLKKYQQWS